jgi:hypothetical protein
VIDPVLSYSTALGGNDYETSAEDLAIDSAGNAYVTGTTNDPNFPTQDPLQQLSSGVFISKLNPSGSELIYSTYLGGNGLDFGYGIEVDRDGAIYLCGETTSRDFPLVNPLQPTLGRRDAFVAKLNPAGSALIYSTYLGGSDTDAANDIEVDLGGNVYLAGSTSSTDFPTRNPLQPANGGSDDAFVTKLNAAGSALVYSTYLGGSMGDGNDPRIAIDSAGCVYVTGNTRSANFPVVNALQPALAGTVDAFATKINTAGSALVYSTYLGGTREDRGGDIALDALGNVYLTGATYSADFPTLNPIQPTYAGERDGFVVRLNPAGSALISSTYLGGTGGDVPRAIAVDAKGCIYIAGYTSSKNFPNIDGVQPIPDNYSFYTEAFIVKLDAAISRFEYSTYLGGNWGDDIYSLEVDGRGHVYVAGQTMSSDFPTTPGAFQRWVPLARGTAFIAKINDRTRQTHDDEDHFQESDTR